LGICKIVCGRKSTCMAKTKILTDSTRKRHKYEDFVYKLKKSVIPTIFQHVYGKHNLVSFYGRIVFWHRRFLYYSFFFQENTLGDISIKLETKIMNFMTFFFFLNIIKTTQVLSIIYNTICLQCSHYQAPLQSLGLFLLITSRISDF
jgi:hypothetical protein